MKEIKGDIFDYIGIADAICVTTNGIVKKNGELVMGAGIAKAMADKYPDLAKVLGKKVNTTGKNIVFKGMNLFCSLYFASITIDYLGKNLYGVWVTVASIISWMGMGDLGVGNGLRNEVAKCIATDNQEKLN